MESVLSPGPFCLQATCCLVCFGLGGRKLVGVSLFLSACGHKGHKAADSLLGSFLQGGTTLHLLWDLCQHFCCPEPQFPHLISG